MAGCIIDGCERRHVARGMCTVHYHRWHRHGDPLAGRPARRRACRVDGCESISGSGKRGWCVAHYQRWLRHGDPLGGADRPGAPRLDVMARVLDNILVTDDGCWVWMGALDYTGYARMSVDGVPVGVHRAVYEELVGPIPAGADLHHRCGNRPCCAPAHLEPLSRADHRALHGSTH